MIALKDKPGLITKGKNYNVEMVDPNESEEDTNPFTNTYYFDADDGHGYTMCECSARIYFGIISEAHYATYTKQI